jgi:GNAT superfamily N-acetyltransferase
MSHRELPLGWHTDLAVLRIHGSTVEERADHLVVRTPANPLYHWGNFVLVTDPSASDDADRWIRGFEEEFPDAGHRAIGLVAEPSDPEVWSKYGLSLEGDDVLATDDCPAPTPTPQGYLVRQLEDSIGWDQSTGLRVAELPEDDRREAEFERLRTEERIATSKSGKVAWFGAFHGDRLAAELGIVDCGGGIARYQSVVTAAEHRRHGLAGHLLGVAAGWAADRGASRWVIVADAGSAASRLYQARGFAPADRGLRAYRKPD